MGEKAERGGASVPGFPLWGSILAGCGGPERRQAKCSIYSGACLAQKGSGLAQGGTVIGFVCLVVLVFL